jgi:hypothetical protein
MCRNIRPLFNYDPPATEADMRASALQYVRKVSGFTKPSKTNEAAFDAAVEDVFRATHALMVALTTTAAPRDRAAEVARLRARSAERYGSAKPGTTTA